MRATDTIYGDIGQFRIIKAPTTSNGTTYGAGSAYQVLVSNGTNTYWSAPADSSGQVITDTYVKLRGSNTISADNTFSGTNTFSGQVILTKTDDAAGLIAGKKPALIVGGAITGQHLEMDGNEIISKSNDSTVADLNLNVDGGQVITGGNFVAKGRSSTDGSTVTWTGGQIYAGDEDSTAQQVIQARSISGKIGLYSNGNTAGDGERGLRAYPHGTDASGKAIIKVDTNNVITYAGGYISGDLSRKSGVINAQATNNNVTSKTTLSAYLIRDANDLIMSKIETAAETDGTISSYWFVRNYNGSTTQVAQEGLKISMDKSGQMSYFVSRPIDFRTAIGICYGVCETASSTPAKEVTLDSHSTFSLTNGTMIAVKFTAASSGSPMTLSINGGEPKRLYLYGTNLMSNSTTTNGWIAGAVVLFVYDATLDGWTRTYWSNTTEPTNILSRATSTVYAETSANGGIGLMRYVPQMMTTNQKWSAIACNTASPTASTPITSKAKTAATANFLINSPIIYTHSNVYVAPGNSGNVNGFAIANFNLRYSIGTTDADVTLTYQTPVYLVGIPNSDGCTFKLDPTQWWTQDPDNFTNKTERIFIYLGITNNASNVYMAADHPIFCHNGTTLCPFLGTRFTAINADPGFYKPTGNLTVNIGWNGTNSTGNNTCRVKSADTSIGLFANSNGYRGLWAYENGDAAAKYIVRVNSSNTIHYNAGYIDGNLLPNVTSSYILGSSNYKWKQIFVENTSGQVGEVILSRGDNGQFKIGYGATDTNVGLWDTRLNSGSGGWLIYSNGTSVLNKGTWDGNTIDITHGGTGASSIAEAKANLNLGAVGQNFEIYPENGAEQTLGFLYTVIQSTTGENKPFAGRNLHLIIRHNGLQLYDATNERDIWTMTINDGNSVYFAKTNQSGVIKSNFTLS